MRGGEGGKILKEARKKKIEGRMKEYIERRKILKEGIY